LTFTILIVVDTFEGFDSRVIEVRDTTCR